MQKAKLYARATILLIGLLGTSVIGQVQPPSHDSGVLVVHVTDAFEGAPIPRAFVFLHGRGGAGDRVVRLDPEGRFKATVPVGLYDLFVAADGFTPACIVVSIEAGEAAQPSFKLTPDLEHLVP